MENTPARPLLQVRGLGKVYGSGQTAVAALQDVSFTVERGSFVSIVGPSGSGKSTLLHILGGVDRPTAGQVLVDGVDIGTLPESRLAVFRRRQIGLVYQFYNLIPALTVEENLALPLLLDRRPIDRARLVELASTGASFTPSPTKAVFPSVRAISCSRASTLPPGRSEAR